MKCNKSVTTVMGVFAITTFAMTGAEVLAAGESPEKSISVLEGKCGEGKCGTLRVRQMMDKNDDGKINRKEYLGWAKSVASDEFDKIASGSASVSAEKVFDFYKELQEQVQAGE